MACVSGRLQIRSWTDKDGNSRRNAEIVADNVYFADSKNTADSGSRGATAQQAAPAAGSFDVIDEDDGQLPF
jgi:single-strand DNA-binding protein